MSNTDGPAALRRIQQRYTTTPEMRRILDECADAWQSERELAATDRDALAQARALAEQAMARAERAEEQAFCVTMETYRTGLVGDAFRFMQYWQERSLKQSAAARKVAQAYRELDAENSRWIGIVSGVLHERDAARAEAARLLEALKRIEHIDYGNGLVLCPRCGFRQLMGHGAGCELAAALRGPAQSE